VHRGRHGLELRVDGTLATLVHDDGRAAAAIVWQALAAPLLSLHSRRRRLRVLVLGLGGGGVVRAIRSFAPRSEIVGVEIDAEVIALAREHLGLDDLGVEIVHDSAEHVLRTDRRRYDAVIDDVFVGDARTVRKPAWMLEWGYAAAWKRVRAGGLLVANSIDETRQVAAVLRRLPGRTVSLDVAGFYNTMLAHGRDLPTARELRALLRRDAPETLHLDLLELRTLRRRRP
jgi:spermidine synthase